jgi:hypothetical protein
VFVLFGWRTRLRTKAGGVFLCPACRRQSPYTVTEAIRWFTLFFLPVIPLGKRGSHISCGSCGGIFKPQVLDASVQAQIRQQMAPPPGDLPQGSPLPPPPPPPAI